VIAAHTRLHQKIADCSSCLVDSRLSSSLGV
jgi:hypothetical protein